MVRVGYSPKLCPGNLGRACLLNSDPKQGWLHSPSPESPRLPVLLESCRVQALTLDQRPPPPGQLELLRTRHACGRAPRATAPAVRRKTRQGPGLPRCQHGSRQGLEVTENQREKESLRPVCSLWDCRGPKRPYLEEQPSRLGEVFLAGEKQLKGGRTGAPRQEVRTSQPGVREGFTEEGALTTRGHGQRRPEAALASPGGWWRVSLVPGRVAVSS